MKLTPDDIDSIKNTNPIELFCQGIRSKETKKTYTHMLRRILCRVCEDVLDGTFEERAAELVERAKSDPEWARNLVLKIVMRWREKTILDPLDPEYLNPSTLKFYLCPVKKLLDMNDVALPWKRIYETYPEVDNKSDTRGWNFGEVRTMLACATNVQTRAIILMLASSGMRAGGLMLKWGDIDPIYRVDGKLVEGKDAPELQATCKPVCASVRVYQGSSEEYFTFITPEAYCALMDHAAKWEEDVGRPLVSSDPVFKQRGTFLMPLDAKMACDRIIAIVNKSRVRATHVRRGRRHHVPAVQGFRRFWNKTFSDNRIGDAPMSSIIKKEYMMGHYGVMPLDRNYYQTHPLELAEEYLHVVDALTISEAERLRIANRQKDEKIRELEAQSNERMGQLEDMIRVISNRLDSLSG